MNPKYFRGIRRVSAWLVFLAPLLLAQNEPFTLKVEVPVVSVDVVVTDANGALVNNLNKGDFQIYEAGTPQDIQFFSPVSAPYSVFLLFDRSRSTQERWTFMQNAVVNFIENLRPQDGVALGSFDKGYDVHLPWTTDRGKAIRALDQVVKEGEGDGTRFYVALERTLRREFRNVTGRRAVVVLTDGKDTDYSWEHEEDLQKALEAAREQRIPVYVIAVEDPGDAGVALPRTRQYLLEIRTHMQQLAESSGGQILFPKTMDDFMPIYQQIGSALGTSYSLGYSGTSSRPGVFRTIEVRTRPGLRITQSRTGYVAR